MKIDVLNTQNAEVIKSITLDKNIFGVDPHSQAMFDVIVSQRASLRQGTSSVKDRGAVSGGGRKPWKQKGTGRARQGSIRAPQWYKGGVVFGPTPEANYKRKVNRKVYRLGIKSILSDKIKRNEIIVIEDLKFSEFATRQAVSFLNTFKLSNKKILIIVTELTDHIVKSFANIKKLNIITAKQINPLVLVNNQVVIMTESAIKSIEEGLK